jgi:hypothetical protein
MAEFPTTLLLSILLLHCCIAAFHDKHFFEPFLFCFIAVRKFVDSISPFDLVFAL